MQNPLLRKAAIALLLVLGTMLSAKESKISILYINDALGKIEEDASAMEAGFSKLASYKDSIKDSEVLLINPGNTLHGKPISSISLGKVPLLVMNSMGFTAFVPNTHDFAYGYLHLVNLSSEANFPFLSANIARDDGNKDFAPYLLKEVGKVKIGIIGLSSNRLLHIMAPKNISGMHFIDSLESAKAAAKELKSKGANFIILVSHLGSGLEALDATQLAQGLPNIDLIIDSHGKEAREEKVGDTLIVQSACCMNGAGRVDLVFKGKKLKSMSAKNIPYQELAALPQNPRIDRIIHRYDEIYNKPIIGQIVGENLSRLEGSREIIRTQETNLGSLCADLMLAAAKPVGAELALINAGAIKNSIEPGKVNMAKLLDVFPFQDVIVAIQVSGADIKAALNHAASKYPKPFGGFLQVAGLSFTLDIKDEQRVKDVLIAGKPLELEANYVLATNDFLAEGGDGFSMLAEKPFLGTFGSLAEEIGAYFLQNKSLDAKVKERIKIVE